MSGCYLPYIGKALFFFVSSYNLLIIYDSTIFIFYKIRTQLSSCCYLYYTFTFFLCKHTYFSIFLIVSFFFYGYLISIFYFLYVKFLFRFCNILLVFLGICYVHLIFQFLLWLALYILLLFLLIFLSLTCF